MRIIALLACALLLTSVEAFAGPAKRVSATGCAMPIGVCPALRSGSGGFFLVGLNLPPPGTRATVQGQLSGDQNFLCPTRLIMRGTIAVASWKPARGKC
jgi:hypothetical protein